MDYGLLNQLQIFWQLHDRIARAFNRLELHELYHLINPRLSTGFDMLVFLTMKFQFRYLILFHLFSVIDSFKWFWVENIHNNIQLMLKFLKTSFLLLNFSYYILMTFLIILPVILLLILLSTLKCDQISDLCQQLELAQQQLGCFGRWYTDFGDI